MLTVEVEIDGEKKRFSEWVRHFNVVSYATAHSRYWKYGWDAKRACTEPPRSEFVIDGTPDTLKSWCEKLGGGVTPALASQRMKRGWSPKRACSEPVNTEPGGNHGALWTINGVSKTLSEWCEHYGVVGYDRAYRRLQQGWSIEEAVSTPLLRKGQSR